MPLSLFTTAKKVTILTYQATSSLMAYYFTRFGLSYSVDRDAALDHYYRKQFKQLVTLKPIHALSTIDLGFGAQEKMRLPAGKKVVTALKSLKRNHLDGVSDNQIFLSCNKDNWLDSEGRPRGLFAKDSRLTKVNFVARTTKGTNNYRHCTHAIYLNDLHLSPNILGFLGLTKEQKEQWALSEFLQWAYRIKAILELAKSEPGMSINADQLDRNPVLLGVKNGVVNLHTGKLLENEPRYYITKYCPVDYDPDYSCIRWEKFIHEVLQDPDTVNSFQRILGQSVTGETDAEHIVLNVGTGANGKSIAGNVITRILGAYAVTAPPSLLAARRADDHSARSDLAMLAGSRLASVNELPGGMILDEVMVKHLAGREPISARQLYKEHFTFLPTFTVWVRTNHMPIIKGTDHGIWRRMIVFRYGRTFTEAEQDPHLEEKLMGEKEGILAWIVRGAQAYFEGGLALSASMKAEVQRYRSDSDLFGEFLDERTRADPDLKEHQHLLYQNYRYWCDSNGLRPISKRTFTEQLSERGYGQSKSGKNRYYTGLKIA